MSGCTHILVMGVAGSGKTTIATGLARELGLEMIEGDDYHPATNVEKMAAGIPLTDDDRWPWLQDLAEVLADRHSRGVSTVLSCSALRRSYRDVLRSRIPSDESFAVLLDADAATLRARVQHRVGHFMPSSLLETQLATLEPLRRNESGVHLDATGPIDSVVAHAIDAVTTWWGRR